MFGVFLFYFVYKMWFLYEVVYFNKNLVIKYVSWFILVIKEFDGEYFFVKWKYIIVVMFLFVVFMVVEMIDVMFVFDSIFVIFVIMIDFFLVFIFNIFVIFGLCFLYFVLVFVLDCFKYL